MHTPRNQQTIARPATVAGIGYWSGRDVRVEFRPAAEDTGIVFVRRDLPGAPRIPATIAHRVDAQRRTNLRCGESMVEMVEHVMAALAGLHVDNCEVHVDQQEMPGLDGSSQAFVEALDAAGIERQMALREQLVVEQVQRLGTAECWIEARPCCSGRTVLQYELDYGPESPIGQQRLELRLTPETFLRELAPCRTFLLQAEAEALLRRGLGKHASFHDLLVFGPQGVIDNTLRFPDECVRHKMLDMTGDLALAGMDLVGRFSACRTGHQLNGEMVRTLLAGAARQESLKRCA